MANRRFIPSVRGSLRSHARDWEKAISSCAIKNRRKITQNREYCFLRMEKNDDLAWTLLVLRST